MSFASTTAAFVMLPLLSLLYLKSLYKVDIEIPYLTICSVLLLILIPTAIGMRVRHVNTVRKFRGRFIWQWLKVGSTVAGVAFIMAALGGGIFVYQGRILKSLLLVDLSFLLPKKY